MDPRTTDIPNDHAAICGLYWEGSAWYATFGATCASQGDAGLVKICPVYTCAREHGVEHCGVCPEFPCILLVHMAAQTGHGDQRIASAALRGELGNDLWVAWAREQRTWVGAYCPLRSVNR
ncbi:MAG TPA: DUF3795 domain-containing protein [bacterium]|nr:DUF3795 domain-containing protein [bacterium]